MICAGVDAGSRAIKIQADVADLNAVGGHSYGRDRSLEGSRSDQGAAFDDGRGVIAGILVLCTGCAEACGKPDGEPARRRRVGGDDEIEDSHDQRCVMTVLPWSICAGPARRGQPDYWQLPCSV